MPLMRYLIVSAGVVSVLSGCIDGNWNSPYPVADRDNNTLYSSFSERPKHLDPVRSYSSSEYAFIAQIYEPLLQYHFLKRPYELVPLTTSKMPEIRYFDARGRALRTDVSMDRIAFSEYEIEIQPGIQFQPHPALAQDGDGTYRFHALPPEQIAQAHTLADIGSTGSRELTAADYIYQIKRMADARLHCPIAPIMDEYIVGFSQLAESIAAARESQSSTHYLDLRRFELDGVRVLDRYRFRIRIKGKYPQFVYWMAMPFFAPMPWEADAFYSQPGMSDQNLNLHWYPLGTGPFMLTENNPNLRMVMDRNPNFRGEPYPTVGSDEDAALGLLEDAGRPMPFIDRAVYSLEKETIPYWNKFLQGYYDASGVSSDSFDQAVQFGDQGQAGLTDDMRERGIKLSTAVSASVYYMGFNMLDPVIGGDGMRARKLRQALSIAVDYEENISIFANGRGIAAQSPLPPGIFGYREGEAGMNPQVYRWVNGKRQRRSIDEAKALMAEANYRDGIDGVTGKPLVLYFDSASTGPDAKARLNWMRKQFERVGIQLVVRATDYNRFQEKMLKGGAQIFQWGWNADYPDPENFLFMLYGPNAKVSHGGENASNYSNADYDALFERMKNMDNGFDRQKIIDKMLALVQYDAPWIWGYHPQSFSLHHDWYKNVKPNLMANNTLKYKRINVQDRTAYQSRWNRPVVWPLFALLAVVVVSVIPAVVTYRRRMRKAAL
jgi:ABC-type transport system substrate-binding protein